MSYRPKSHRDENHAEIKEAFEKFGATMVDVSMVPNFVDLLGGYRGIDFQVEVKTPKGRVAKHQQDHADTWNGRRPVVVRTTVDVENVLKGMR